MIRELLPEVVREAVASQAGARSVWLVGGAIRDQFLERTTEDFDFAVERDAIGLARSVADELGAYYFTLDAERDAGRVVPDGDGNGWRRLDFAGLRADSIEGDLRARDFTVNAMALRIADSEPELIDPTGGVRDVKDRRLRLCASDALERDPVRALRAVRLAADLEFQLDASV
ncbi:MAG: hypothetical protein R3191_02290, partial [Anaerolineales bacterium]|nr:hypothetical protein [Anaerolineales bacterium]